jgi:hypothetical protein
VHLLNHTSLPLFILFIVALIQFSRRKEKWRYFFLLSLLTPCFIFTFISVKWARYILPLLTFIAIISAWLIENLKLKYLKRIIFGGLFFYCIALYFLTSFKTWYAALSPLHLPPFPIDLSAHPPDPNGYVEEIKKGEAVSYIQNKLKNEDEIKIKFTEGTHHIALALFLFFQDDIFNKIDIQRDDKLEDFNDVDCVILKESDLLYRGELLKNYKILSKWKEALFSVRK